VRAGGREEGAVRVDSASSGDLRGQAGLRNGRGSEYAQDTCHISWKRKR
jgi:hypothetical protein